MRSSIKKFIFLSFCLIPSIAFAQDYTDDLTPAAEAMRDQTLAQAATQRGAKTPLGSWYFEGYLSMSRAKPIVERGFNGTVTCTGSGFPIAVRVDSINSKKLLMQTGSLSAKGKRKGATGGQFKYNFTKTQKEQFKFKINPATYYAKIDYKITRTLAKGVKCEYTLKGNVPAYQIQ